MESTPSTEPAGTMKFGRLRRIFVIALHSVTRLVVRLPFRLQLWLGKRFGLMTWYLVPGRRRIADCNLELCMPELSPAERKELVKRHFECLGASIVETAMGWSGNIETVRSLVRFEGREHLEAGLAKGKGVILYSAHFTTMEFSFPALRHLFPRIRLTGMYKEQRNPVMTRIMNQGRMRNVDELISKDNVRSIFRNLRRNAVVWYAADQSYSRKGAELIPFFGEPAMTNTAIWRIAQATGATVLPYFPRRLADDSGYVVSIGAPLPGFPTDDVRADVSRLVHYIEEHIRLCPEQYWWVHKRFKGRPAPYRDVYGKPGASSKPGTDTTVR